MPRCYVAGRAGGIGTTARPMISVFAPSGLDIRIVEVGVFNTAAVAVAVALRRMTAQGTPGSALVEGSYDPDYTPLATAFDVHTADATFVSNLFTRYASLSASVGGGVIWTFGAGGLRLPKGTGNGYGVVLATGTGQICDIHIDWDE